MMMGKRGTLSRVGAGHVAMALALLSPGCGASTHVDAVPDGAASDANPPADAGSPDAGFVLPPLVRDGGYIACSSPHPLIVAGQDTGFDECEGNAFRRRANKVCPDLLPRPDTCSVFQGSDAGCHSDSDCVDDAGPYATCVGSNGACWCLPGCAQDSDCPAGTICFCGNDIGQCVPGTCAAGTCPPGSECAATRHCSGGDLAFACQTKADTCLSDIDCTGGDGCYVNRTTGVRGCTGINCGF
jgi:hypothetical protein